jgi:hypothetical protein
VNSHSDTPVNTEKGVASAPMAERLRSAFRKCIEMDGTLGKRLSAYACREPIDFSRLRRGCRQARRKDSGEWRRQVARSWPEDAAFCLAG